MKTDIEKLDQLTRQRLARLGQAPVDTSGLEHRLEAILWQRQRRGRLAGLWSPRFARAAMAAIVLIAAGTFFVVQGGGTPVVAAPIALAQLHRDLVAGQVPVVAVSSIQQARDYLTTEWKEAPPLPDPTAATVTSCCRHNLQNRNVACVLMDYRGQQVTMMVGRSRDLVCGAKHEAMMRNGHHYAVHEADDLRMVMIESKGRWVCLMSPASVDTLMDLADSLRF
jgi:hypothetical protein